MTVNMDIFSTWDNLRSEEDGEDTEKGGGCPTSMQKQVINSVKGKGW